MRSIARVRAAPVLLLKRRVLGLKIPTSFWVSFSLVPFFWTSKRKVLAVGQPPTRLSGPDCVKTQNISSNHEYYTSGNT